MRLKSSNPKFKTKIMKSIKHLPLFIAMAIFFLGANQNATAQDANAEAISTFNNAIELAENKDFDNAIGLFEEALQIAEQNDLADIKERVENQLPKVYASRASDAYSTYQSNKDVPSLNEAIRKFEEANEAAQRFGDDQIAERTRGVIPQLYYIKGVLHFRQQDLNASEEALNQAIQLNSNYAVAYYQKALVQKRKNRSNVDSYLQWIDRAIQVGEQVGDNTTVEKAKNNAVEELVYQGVQQADQRRFDSAISLLSRALDYDSSSPDAHYRLAEVYNKRSNWSRAIEHAQQALQFESGGVVDKAKIYFELGTAYQGSGQKTQACNAFEEAAHGEFRDPSLHKMEHELKCEGYASAGRR